LRLSIERGVIAVLADQHLGEQRRCGQAASNQPFRRGACTTLLQARQAYFGRAMRTTRSCAGTQSSISLTLSPMACNVPPQQPQTLSTTSQQNVFVRQMIGQWFASRRSHGCFRDNCRLIFLDAAMPCPQRVNSVYHGCLMDRAWRAYAISAARLKPPGRSLSGDGGGRWDRLCDIGRVSELTAATGVPFAGI
jgi:hypothetical protein